jgi:transcriptional regulator with XRE-family HTH domain
MPVDTSFGQLQARIDALRMKRSHVAALTGLSAGYLSQAASGQSNLSYPDFRTIEHLLDSCERLQRKSGGVPIDWRNVGIVKMLLVEMRDEDPVPTTDVNGR